MLNKLILVGACFASAALPAANVFITEGEHNINEYTVSSGDIVSTRNSATLNITGGEWTVGGLITDGVDGDTLNISGGAVVNVANYLWASWNFENTNSTWNISGSGTRLNLNSAGQDLRMGFKSGAKVAATVSGGAALYVARDIVIGESESTNASLEINGSSSSLSLGSGRAVKIANGANSIGVLKFANGANFSTDGGISMGAGASSNASLIVDSSTFSSTNSGAFYLAGANSSSASLQIKNGANFSIGGDMYIAYGASSSASFELNNASFENFSHAISIANGASSSGSINILNHSVFSYSLNNIYLGVAEGSSASILVDNSSFALGNKTLFLSTLSPAADSSIVFQNGASGSLGALDMGGNSSHEASMTVSGNSSVVVSGMSNIGQVEGANAVVNVSGGTLTMNGQLNLGSYSAGASQNSGTGTINLSSGELRLGGTAFLGAYKNEGVLNQTGGKLSKDGASQVSRMVIGFTSDGTYQISGGSASVAQIDVGGWIIAKGVQSKLILKSNAELSSGNIIVGVASGNANFEGSNAYLISSSGANLSATNLTVYDSGEIKIKLDSSAYNPSNNTIAGAFQAGTLALNRSANVETGILAIDVSGLGKVDGLSEGDVVRIDLFSFSNNMTYNGVVYDKGTNIADFLGDRISIVGESQYWESMGLDFIEFDASTKTAFVSLTYLIPEPSAYAVVFGAIALAFIAIRRRK